MTKTEMMPLLQVAHNPGGSKQIGTDMRFETVPAHPDSFGNATADELHAPSNEGY